MSMFLNFSEVFWLDYCAVDDSWKLLSSQETKKLILKCDLLLDGESFEINKDCVEESFANESNGLYNGNVPDCQEFLNLVKSEDVVYQIVWDEEVVWLLCKK